MALWPLSLMLVSTAEFLVEISISTFLPSGCVETRPVQERAASNKTPTADAEERTTQVRNLHAILSRIVLEKGSQKLKVL